MRAARTGKDPAPHLLAALDQATGTVLAQARVADKSNEIPALRELLKPLDLDGVVVSADAMHTQTDTAEWTRPAGRSLRAHASGQSEDPAQDSQEAALQGRPVHLLGRRLSRAASATHRQGGQGSHLGGLSRSGSVGPRPAHPNHQGSQARMVAVAPRGRLWRWSTRVCSLPMGQAQPEQVAAWVRGHWKIENRLHWVRDVVFDESPPAAHR